MNDSRRYENLLVGIMFFTWGTVFLDRMSGLYLAPFIAREFQLTNEQIGLLASVLAITWAISTLLFGAVSDRVGRRQQAKMCALHHFAPGTAVSRNGLTAVASAREELML